MTDAFPEDFIDLVSCFRQEECVFLVVGAHALAAHGAPAAEDTVTGHLGSETVRCIGFEALIRNKRASGRTKDLADVEALEEIRDRVHRGG